MKNEREKPEDPKREDDKERPKRRPYTPPKVESVKLTKEAAEALT